MESKEKILNAAIEVFAEKGKYGARMEEIAARASINKAMLYYFYTSRENLFKAALMHVFERIHSWMETEIMPLMGKKIDPATFIREIVRAHFQVYSRNQNFTRIMLQALANDPQELKTAIDDVHEQWHKKGCCHKGPESLIQFIEDNVKKGVFRKVNAKQIMVSIIGVNMIYFATKPITESMLGFAVEDEDKFIEERQESNIDLLLNGIMVNRSKA